MSGECDYCGNHCLECICMECDSCGQIDAECHCYMNEEFDKLYELCDRNTDHTLKLMTMIRSLESRIEHLEINCLNLNFGERLNTLEDKMDKDYNKVEKEAGKLKSDLKKVESKDKKRDKFVDAGKKAMKQAKKK